MMFQMVLKSSRTGPAGAAAGEEEEVMGGQSVLWDSRYARRYSHSCIIMDGSLSVCSKVWPHFNQCYIQSVLEYSKCNQ